MSITVSDWSWGRLTLQARKQYDTYMAQDIIDPEVAEEMFQTFLDLQDKAVAAGELARS